jgi:hypothetical protein
MGQLAHDFVCGGNFDHTRVHDQQRSNVKQKQSGIKMDLELVFGILNTSLAKLLGAL